MYISITKQELRYVYMLTSSPKEISQRVSYCPYKKRSLKIKDHIICVYACVPSCMTTKRTSGKKGKWQPIFKFQ